MGASHVGEGEVVVLVPTVAAVARGVVRGRQGSGESFSELVIHRSMGMAAVWTSRQGEYLCERPVENYLSKNT